MSPERANSSPPSACPLISARRVIGPRSRICVSGMNSCSERRAPRTSAPAGRRRATENIRSVQRHAFDSRSWKPRISCGAVDGSSIFTELLISSARGSLTRRYKSKLSGSRTDVRQNRPPSKCCEIWYPPILAMLAQRACSAGNLYPAGQIAKLIGSQQWPWIVPVPSYRLIPIIGFVGRGSVQAKFRFGEISALTGASVEKPVR